MSHEQATHWHRYRARHQAPASGLHHEAGQAQRLHGKKKAQVHDTEPEERNMPKPVHAPLKTGIAAQPLFLMKKETHHQAGKKTHDNPGPGQNEV
jgi:hypothetical protein